jgi:DNA-binding GntR family transcriptional regulator
VNNLSVVAPPARAVSGLNGRETAIFSSLRAAITEQRLLPGARLTEEELAEIYDTSRMRIRRVLLALAQTGMIDLPPGRGAQVARPSAAEARGVFSARRLIEGRLLEAPEAVPGAPALATLASLVRREDEAAHANERAAMIQLSGAFHVELARAYGNAVIADIVAGLVTRSSLIIALFQTKPTSCCLPGDHGKLLETLAAGNFKAAGAEMRAHLEAIEAALNLEPAPLVPVDLRAILVGARPLV